MINENSQEPDEREERDEPALTLEAIGSALRSIRRQRGLTLRGVENESDGRWKSVVVGSYERGDRALTLKKAIGLASFYNVPLDQLLGLSLPATEGPKRLTFDLSAVRRSGKRLPEPLLRYLQEICRLRSDWNGVMLSTRATDTLALASIADKDPEALRQWAIDQGILIG
jgi:transcriptional regulator with XRE-family HTH domain